MKRLATLVLSGGLAWAAPQSNGLFGITMGGGVRSLFGAAADGSSSMTINATCLLSGDQA